MLINNQQWLLLIHGFRDQRLKTDHWGRHSWNIQDWARGFMDWWDDSDSWWTSGWTRSLGWGRSPVRVEKFPMAGEVSDGGDVGGQTGNRAIWRQRSGSSPVIGGGNQMNLQLVFISKVSREETCEEVRGKFRLLRREKKAQKGSEDHDWTTLRFWRTYACVGETHYPQGRAREPPCIPQQPPGSPWWRNSWTAPHKARGPASSRSLVSLKTKLQAIDQSIMWP